MFISLYCYFSLISVFPLQGFAENNDAILGDINGDGKISAADARLTLRYAAKLIEFTDKQKLAADITGDGKITSASARKILRLSAKIDTLESIQNQDTFNLSNVGKFSSVVSDGVYHYIASTYGDIYKWEIGSDKYNTILSNEHIDSLGLIDDKIVVGSSNKIFTIDKNGKNKKINHNNLHFIMVYKNEIYGISYTDDYYVVSIVRMDMQGNIIKKYDMKDIKEVYVSNFLVYKDKIYFSYARHLGPDTAQSYIETIDINTESKKTAVKEDGYIVKFTISNNSIYYLSIITQEHEDGLFERGKLTKCNLDGTNKTEVLQQNVIPYHDPTCPFNVTPENEIYTLIKVKGSEKKFVAAEIVLDGWAYGWAWNDPYNYNPESINPANRFLGEAQIRLDGSALYIFK